MGDEPVATGTLAKTPLPHLLIYLDQRQLSGTLAIWPDVVPEGDKRQDRVLLLKGRPVAGRLIDPTKNLREGLLKLFYRTEAPYAFYDGNLLGDAEGRLNGRVDPLSLITESLRMTAREDVVEGVLGRIGDGRLRMAPKVELARFDLLPEERSLIDLVMAEPASIDDLVAGSGLPAPRARRLIYLLLISKALAAYEDPHAAARAPVAPPTPVAASAPAAAAPAAVPSPEPSAPSTSTSSPDMQSVPPLDGYSKAPGGRLDRLAEMPSPPDGLSPELTERWQRITTRARLIENQNYFEMLGLDKKAMTTDAKTEFFKLAKEWHPDRLPADLQSLRPHVEIIFSYMNEAYKILGDEEQRLLYLRTVREGGGTPAAERMIQSILDSAIAYERVQVFVRKHQYDEALELLTRILTLTKDEPDYHAMHGFILMSKFPGADAPTGKMLEAFDRAISLYADHEKAHTYKGLLLKRLGREAEALKCFRKVVSINPNNMDASREVRIAQMRDEKKKQPLAAKGAAGLFGRLLGGADDKTKGKPKPKKK